MFTKLIAREYLTARSHSGHFKFCVKQIVETYNTTLTVHASLLLQLLTSHMHCFLFSSHLTAWVAGSQTCTAVYRIAYAWIQAG